MQLIRDFTAIPDSALKGAVTIGNFDGVHRGHAHLIRELVAAAKSGPAVVVTFEPHPLTILRPALAPQRLTWIERKAELLGRLGVTHVVVLNTTAELLEWSPQQFFEFVLQVGLETHTIVEGPNFHFGKNRAGNISVLRQLCAINGIALEVVQPDDDGGQWISSTRIRLLLEQGKVREANQLLTEPYQLRGQVVTGAKRGREIGFPTLNLDHIDTMLPGHGAFAGRTTIAGKAYRVAINIGRIRLLMIIATKSKPTCWIGVAISMIKSWPLN